MGLQRRGVLLANVPGTLPFPNLPLVMGIRCGKMAAPLAELRHYEASKVAQLTV